MIVYLLNLRSLLIKLGKHIDFADYTFVDVGCGTGVSTIYAANYSFGRVIGIDFQPDLIHIAKKNLVSGKRINREIIFETSDFRHFRLDPKSRYVFFLFNPFESPVLRDFLEKNQFDISHCSVWIILINDLLRSELVDSSLFELVYEDKGKKLSILSNRVL